VQTEILIQTKLLWRGIVFIYVYGKTHDYLNMVSDHEVVIFAQKHIQLLLMIFCIGN